MWTIWNLCCWGSHSCCLWQDSTHLKMHTDRTWLRIQLVGWYLYNSSGSVVNLLPHRRSNRHCNRSSSTSATSRTAWRCCRGIFPGSRMSQVRSLDKYLLWWRKDMSPSSSRCNSRCTPRTAWIACIRCRSSRSRRLLLTQQPSVTVRLGEGKMQEFVVNIS